MNGKQKIIFYRDWSDTFDRLTNEEAGELIKYFCDYISDKNPKEPSRLTGLLFEPIKQTLKRDLEKWEATCERNKKNGESGGRPKNVDNQKDNENPTKPNKTQQNPVGFLETQQNPKKPDIDIDIDRDIEYKESNLKITKEKKFNFKKALLDFGIEGNLVEDWLEVRQKKKAANTETAYNAIIREINKSGISANECIRIAVERSWQGFKADWLIEKNYKNGNQQQKSGLTADELEKQIADYVTGKTIVGG